MFEKCTQGARRAVFFARFEASQSGSPCIEPEHLLLGILREEGHLLEQLLPPAKVAALYEQIRQAFPAHPKISTSVDLPLSTGSKRVFQYAAQEAKRLKEDDIGSSHLLLGISREESCAAARLLRENGITTAQLRDRMAHQSAQQGPAEPEEAPPAGIAARDLVEAARKGQAGPLVGRERELERVIHILSRRTRNNPVLIGEAGVGKTAIVNGLASCIAAESQPLLEDRRLIAIDASSLTGPAEEREHIEPLFAKPGVILFVRGLFNLAAAGSAWAVVEAMHALEPRLASGEIQCIATGSPSGLRETLDKAGMLARHFEVVEVAPVSEPDAVRIVSGLKKQFEQFHAVTFAEGAIETAVAISGRFLPGRHLPDRAIDLIDEAAAAVRLKREGEPREIAETRKAIRQQARAMEHAIANHDFDKARQHSDEERREREKLAQLREQYQPDAAANSTVTADDIEAAVAARAGVPVAAVKQALQEKAPGELERIAALLAAQLPAESRDWVPFLAAHLARCSPAEAAALAQAIAAARPADAKPGS